LTERDKNIVACNPVFFWKLRAQGKLGFLRIPGRDISPDIHNAMYVRVHTDSIIAESDGKHKICRFAPDAGQREQFVQRARNHACMI